MSYATLKTSNGGYRRARDNGGYVTNVSTPVDISLFGWNIATLKVQTTFEYVIQNKDGAYKMAAGLSELAGIEITPEVVVRSNPKIFRHPGAKYPDDYLDFNNNPLHHQLAVGPKHKIKTASVTIEYNYFRVLRTTKNDPPFIEFEHKVEKYGAFIDIDIEGNFDGEVLIASGFDGLAKAYVGVRLSCTGGIKYNTVSPNLRQKLPSAELDFVYGADFAFQNHSGKVVMISSSKSSHEPYKATISYDLKNRESPKMKLNTSAEKLQEEINRQKDGGKKVYLDAYASYTEKNDTSVINLGVSGGGKFEADIPLGLIPTPVLRAEFNGKIGAEGHLEIKTFKIGRDYEYETTTELIYQGELDPKIVLPNMINQGEVDQKIMLPEIQKH